MQVKPHNSKPKLAALASRLQVTLLAGFTGTLSAAFVRGTYVRTRTRKEPYDRTTQRTTALASAAMDAAV